MKPQASRPTIVPIWLRTIEATPDPDRAEESDAGHGSEQKERQRAAVERERDAACAEAHIADCEPERLARGAEREPGEHARDEFRTDHA